MSEHFDIPSIDSDDSVALTSSDTLTTNAAIWWRRERERSEVALSTFIADVHPSPEPCLSPRLVWSRPIIRETPSNAHRATEKPSDRCGGHRAEFKSVDAFCREYTPISYAIEPFVRSASLYTLTAKTGAGKTALLISMALAVAAGRSNILGREVTHGRVAYVAAENPDDLRMRIMVAAYLLNIDLHTIADSIVILDQRVKPEELEAKLRALAEDRPFALVLVDTLAAFFDGDDMNDNVQGGQFMRRLRPLTRLPGLPSVIVAAHPVKNALRGQSRPLRRRRDPQRSRRKSYPQGNQRSDGAPLAGEASGRRVRARDVLL